MDRISDLSNDQLRKELLALGANIGPVTLTTRNLYEKKLLKLRASQPAHRSPSKQNEAHNRSPPNRRSSGVRDKNETSPKVALARLQGYTNGALDVSDDGSDSPEEEFDTGNKVIPGKLNISGSGGKHTSPRGRGSAVIAKLTQIASQSPHSPAAGSPPSPRKATPPSPPRQSILDYQPATTGSFLGLGGRVSPTLGGSRISSTSTYKPPAAPTLAGVSIGGYPSGGGIASGGGYSASSYSNRIAAGGSSEDSGDLHGTEWKGRRQPSSSPPLGTTTRPYASTSGGRYGVGSLGHQFSDDDEQADDGDADLFRGSPPRRSILHPEPSSRRSLGTTGATRRIETSFGGLGGVSLPDRPLPPLGGGLKDNSALGNRYSTDYTSSTTITYGRDPVRRSMPGPDSSHSSSAFDRYGTSTVPSYRSGEVNSAYDSERPSAPNESLGKLYDHVGRLQDSAAKTVRSGYGRLAETARSVVSGITPSPSARPDTSSSYVPASESDRWGIARRSRHGGPSAVTRPAVPTTQFSWDKDYDTFDDRGLSSRWNAQSSSKIIKGFLLGLAIIMALYVTTVHSEYLVRAGHIVGGAAMDTVAFLYRKMLIPLGILSAGLAVVLGMFLYLRSRWHREAEEQRIVHEMVQRIIEKLHDHHERCKASGQSEDYLIIPHVRDMLIRPEDRERMRPIWEKAVQFLAENESRIRTESQCISGEDFMVWRWLHRGSADLESVTMPPRSQPSTSGGTGGGGGGGKIWQGSALYNEDVSKNMPKEAFSECLKARGLFDPQKETSRNWPEEIETAILEKIRPVGSVVHIAVDRYSNEGCVFIKCRSKEDARNVFKSLHGNWFDGNLISVKFLRPEKYHQRFPEAQNAMIPLTPKGYFQ